jgi:hypothetical protein
MRLYNLSSTPYALSNIALRRLKISRLSDLNDPFELLAAVLLNPLHRRAFADWKDELSQSTGLICFSKSWRNPLLWGHYADRHTGIALGFEVPDSLPVDVIYSATRVRIATDAKSDKVILNEALMKRLLRTKFEDWKYEDESRVFVELDHSTCEAGMYFKNFGPDLALAEVVIGPKCDLPIDRVRAMVDSAHPGVRVVKARMAYRSFHVIEDRSFRVSKGRA